MLMNSQFRRTEVITVTAGECDLKMDANGTTE